MTSKKGQDFFPYAYNNNFLGGAHSYWSGFYTSKPAFKGLLIRKINAISLDENVIDQNLKIQKLERAVALSQHHDAITGTSKDAVTKDYIRRLLRGWDAGETSLNNALTLLSPSGKNMQNLKICRQMNETDCHDELMG
uniref:Glycoside hydrolase family 38 central domain-containing protein n=1 Tax=Acrobeloides nanus TaxID=290746 RepID=A0A914CWN7_9BILA